MDQELVTNREKFFTFLQFITYVQTLDYKNDSLGSTDYRQVVFQVHDFLRYTNKSQNYY